MAIAPLQKLQVDEVGDSAYMHYPAAKPIAISKEFVVLRVKGVEPEGVENPGVISFSFEVRNFAGEADVDLPIMIFDVSDDGEVCGIEIPHYSHFNPWVSAVAN